MKWKPLTRNEIDNLLAEGLERADDAVRAAWEQIRIEPQKWRCSPWGDAGGGFWAVATSGGQVIWYNDIEDGFNTSRYSTYGEIDEYQCNQDTIDHVLARLPAARAAEAVAAQNPAVEVPSELNRPGSILRRQTTFWELRTESNQLWRLHFSGKQEAIFRSPDYASVVFCDSHPLLIDYKQDWSHLFVASACRSPDAAIDLLARRVEALTSSWRSLGRYLNDAAPATMVLSDGSGLLLHAPRAIIEVAEATMHEFDVQVSVIPGMTPTDSFRVLELTPSSAVIATSFRFALLS